MWKKGERKVEEIRKRRLVIKAFHAEIVREGQENRITRAREIEVAPESFAEKADVCLSFRRKNVSSKTRLLAGRHH